ncbi:MAG: glycosyltransferase [Verrucomicrobia bacterium]|nr:glycosyltransferase [Verrucomicrobiota bacterium]
MKILTYSALPFNLAHGGVTNIYQRTSDVLSELGFEVEPLRWWDKDQTGDVFFCFCRTSNDIVNYAKKKGMKVVVEQVLGGLVSRPLWKRRIQKFFKSFLEKYAPSMMTEAYGWRAFNTADMHFVPSPHDARVVNHMFNVSLDKICVLPYGVDDAFLNAPRGQRANHLICTATVTQRKRVLEVAQAASIGKVPLWIVGKTYGANDDYSEEFHRVVQQSHGIVKHIPHVDGRDALANMLAQSRGFVLLSTMETVSQSALEAAACGCPMLLSDLDWARVAFGSHASYCNVNASPTSMAQKLKNFHDQCPALRQDFQAGSWLKQRGCLREILNSI